MRTLLMKSAELNERFEHFSGSFGVEYYFECYSGVIRLLVGQNGYSIFLNNTEIATVGCFGSLESLYGEKVTLKCDRDRGSIYRTVKGMLHKQYGKDCFLNDKHVATIDRGEGLFEWLKRCYKRKKLYYPDVTKAITYDDKLMSAELAVVFFVICDPSLNTTS